MKTLSNRMIRRFQIASLAVVGALLFTTLPANAQSENSGSDKALQGTWNVTVTPRNCTTGLPAGQPFNSLLTFARGGTLTGTTSNPLFQPGQRTSDYGVWAKESGSTYSAVSEAFILYSTPANPPAPPIGAGRQRISQMISVNGDTFTSAASVKFFDPSGNVTLNLCASASGQRFQ